MSDVPPPPPPDLCNREPRLQNFTLRSESIVNTEEYRMDAKRYDSALFDAIESLSRSGMRLEKLGAITSDLFIPPRFKRVYVDPGAGVPFLQGSHLSQFQPTGLKYLSKQAHDRLERWVVRHGWLLVTCSGTIGRVALCPTDWDGWAASQHILRVVPDERKCPAGYLYAFLASQVGQAQLLANRYGAVVDELTARQASEVLVPVPTTAGDRDLVEAINTGIRDAVAKRSTSAGYVNSAVSRLPALEAPSDGRHVGFSVNSHRIGTSPSLRLDAESYNPQLDHVLDVIAGLGMPTARIGEIAKVFMPNRFKRTYVERGHGLPFLQGIHVTHFQANGLRYLSTVNLENIDDYIVESGQLLVTRSGSVGRVVICPREWDGWLATEDIIRIAAVEQICPTGYLSAFLKSPLGQVQMAATAHGAVVDHLTIGQLRDVLVPLPNSERARQLVDAISREMIVATASKSDAVELVEKNVNLMEKRFPVVADGSLRRSRIGRRLAKPQIDSFSA